VKRLRHDEAGETLLEILVTISVMSIAFVAIIAAIGTSLRLSGSSRRLASSSVALGVAAEAVKAVTPSVACSALTTGSYATALSAATPVIPLPRYWAASNLSISAVACDDTSLLKLQTITIKATAPCPSSCPFETVNVVKRSP
jgi:Tfp pilus assembly protein PilV